MSEVDSGAHASADSPVCHNCGATLHGRFCAACGQEALRLNPSLRDLAAEFVQEVLDTDGRIFRSVRRLFLSPGFLTREHFAGRRVRWVSPIRLYLTFSVAYFALIALTGGNALRINITPSDPNRGIAVTGSGPEIGVSVGRDDQETVKGLQSIGFESEAQLRVAITEMMAVWMPRAMFLLVPLFAWLVGLVRRRSGYSYPQHLLFALHVHAAWFGANAILGAPMGLLQLPADHLVARGMRSLAMLYGIVYVPIAMRVAYGGTKWQATRHTLVVLLVYGLAVIAALAAIVIPVILWRR